MTTGKFTLVIRWPSGQSMLCGEMTDHQHGEICRILSPDHRAELSAIKGGGEAVGEINEGDEGVFVELYPDQSFTLGTKLFTRPPVVAEAEPVGVVYTMQPCFPGEPKRAHAQLNRALPSGTKLYAEPVAPPASGAVPVPEPENGLEIAAKFLEKRAQHYDEEHGHTDHETGTREYPGDGAEYYCELMDMADELRALLAKGVQS